MKKIAICLNLLICQVEGLGCSTPLTLSEPGRDVSSLRLSLNKEGEALTVWISKNPYNKDKVLVAATSDDDKKWSSTILSEAGKEIYSVESFIDNQGNRFVSWRFRKENSEEDEPEYYQFVKREKNQAWSPVVNISDPEDQFRYPRFSFDAQGNGLLFGHAAIKDPKESWGTSDYLISLHYNPQNGEIKKTRLSKTYGGTLSENLVKNEKGKIFAWWEDRWTNFDKDGTFRSEKIIKGSWLQDEGSWSAPKTLFSLSDSALILKTKDVMNSKGDLAMLWEKVSEGEAKKIQAATCFNGQWSVPVDFNASNFYFHDLTLKMNDKSHVAAGWIKTEKGKEIIYVADKPFGQPWSSPIALSDPTKDAHSPGMSIDDQGNIIMVWINEEGIKEVPYAAYKPVNRDWSAPVSLSEGSEGCDHIQVETSQQGHFVVFWNTLQKKQISIHGAALSTATKEWSSATISPPGQDCRNFKFGFNKKGEGIITWKTSWDNQDTYVQVAELNVN